MTLLGRKWVIDYGAGNRQVIEGDKIVGETPRLAPGEEFSYNSHHVTGCDAHVQGGFHGVDESGAEGARAAAALRPRRPALTRISGGAGRAALELFGRAPLNRGTNEAN